MMQMKISVISDTHLLPRYMIAKNESYLDHLSRDRKFLTESEALLIRAFDMIEARGSQLLFVSGDITKDGERLSHERFNSYLKDYLSKDSTRQVFLAPGNHDINNIHAYNYNVDGRGKADRTETVTPVEFMEIYKEFVYDKAFALYKDSDQFKTYLEKVNQKYIREDKYQAYAHGYTSYASRVALNKDEPDKLGMTLVMLDSVKYSIETVDKEIDGVQETSGLITTEQLEWLADIASQAKATGDIILVLSHHAWIPHFYRQDKFLKPYIIDNWKDKLVSSDKRINGKTPIEILADLGVAAIFTGHMHTQDIAKFTSQLGNTTYDIETGSTVTYPLPVRHMQLITNADKAKLEIESEFISSYSYEDLDGQQTSIENAMKHASKDLINIDLIRNLILGYAIPRVTGGSLEFTQKLLGNTAYYSQGFADLLIPSLSKLLGEKEDPLSKRLSRGIHLKSYVSDVTGDGHDDIVFDIQILGAKYGYILSQENMNAFIAAMLEKFDQAILYDSELMDDFVRCLAEDFLNTRLKDEGNILTVSDLINESYRIHLRGDEDKDPDIKRLLDHYHGENFLISVLHGMKDSISFVFDNIISRMAYDGIDQYIQRYTKNNRFLAKFIDRRVYGIVGESLSETLENFKLSPEKIINQLMKMQRLEEQLGKASSYVLDLIRALTTEGQDEYKTWAYSEDNDTSIDLETFM